MIDNSVHGFAYTPTAMEANLDNAPDVCENGGARDVGEHGAADDDDLLYRRLPTPGNAAVGGRHNEAATERHKTRTDARLALLYWYYSEHGWWPIAVSKAGEVVCFAVQTVLCTYVGLYLDSCTRADGCGGSHLFGPRLGFLGYTTLIQLAFATCVLAWKGLVAARGIQAATLCSRLFKTQLGVTREDLLACSWKDVASRLLGAPQSGDPEAGAAAHAVLCRRLCRVDNCLMLLLQHPSGLATALDAARAHTVDVELESDSAFRDMLADLAPAHPT